MMPRVSFILLITACFLSLDSVGQDLNKVHIMAEEAFYDEDFESAFELYEILIHNLEVPMPDFLHKAEICSLLTTHHSQPTKEFFEYEETVAEKDKFYHYWKGRVLMTRHRMREAHAAFDKFLDTEEYLSDEIKREARRWREWVANAEYYMANPDSYEIYPLEKGVNSEYAELSPVFFPKTDELLFISNRNAEDTSKYQVYRTTHEGSKQWTAPSIIPELGIFDRDNANIEVTTEDGKLLLFKPEHGGDLFYSELTEDKKEWSSPVKYDRKITSTHAHPHFFISENKERIIFESNGGTEKDAQP